MTCEHWGGCDKPATIAVTASRKRVELCADHAARVIMLTALTYSERIGE